MAASSLWLADRPLVLASGSATRRMLLDQAGIPVEVCPAAVDERALEADARAAGAGPARVAAVLAAAKARSVSERMPGRLVVGADQTLALGDESFHKPVGRAAAEAQLVRLAGHTHQLHAAVALARDGTVAMEDVRTAQMTMRPLSAGMIARYCSAAGPAVMASVGAYQWEGLGVHLFENVEGDHSTILGLPLLPLLAFLRQEGFVAS